MRPLDLYDLERQRDLQTRWRPDEPPCLNGETRICLDAETNGLEWYKAHRPVGWAFWLPQSGRRGYLPFGHQGGGNLDEEAVKRWMQTELRGVHIDNANTKFDGHMAREWGVDLVAQGCTFGDVAHRAALLDDHRLRFGLDQLAKDLLHVEEGKYQLEGIENKGELWQLPAWDVAPYAIRDVELVHQLVKITEPEIASQHLERVLALEEAIIPVVMEMERNGVYLDLEKLVLWRDQAQLEYQALLRRIYLATGVELTSPDKSVELKRIFLALKIPFTSFTGTLDKDGQSKPSFTNEVLSAIDHPVIKDLLRAGQLADLESKYLGKYLKTVRSDGWMRFNLHQLRVGHDENDAFGTVSGRFSSAGDQSGGFNVQQVVSADKQLSRGWLPEYVVRRLFLPQTPWWLMSDAEQIEYRIFAHFANDPEIMTAYRNDERVDYHSIVQKILQTVKPDIGRKKTKITNFCKLFGSGLIKFALTLETITQQQFDDLTRKYNMARFGNFQERERLMREEPVLQEAVSVMDAYDEKFPSAKTTLQLAKRTANESGYVSTLMGRRARFPKRQRTHSALNRVVQGTAADINKLMLVELFKRRKEFGLTLRMTVHDEVDADLADVSKLPEISRWFNEQRIPLRVPILWSTSVGPNWADAKTKA